jgi:hypothetical protein
MLALTQAQALLLLFVVLPFLVAAVVVAFVSWRSSGAAPVVRTSVILAEGVPAEAEVLAIKAVGGFLDTRPMVRFALRVHPGADQAPFELEVVQSLPRGAAHEIHIGDTLDVRLTADHAAGAIVWAGRFGG